MFENLTDRLQDVLKKINGENILTKANVNSALIEVRKALIEADVSLKVIKLFLDRVRDSAIGEKVVRGINASDKFIEIVNRELISLLGEEQSKLKLTGKPAILMMLGLQGSGKTTTAAKLALSLRDKKVLLVALDLQRPAAIEQLQILGKQVETEVFSLPGEKDILQVAQGALQKAQSENFEVLIFDTAGRLQVDSELMAELLLLERKFKPVEKLLVVDALIGQEAANVAQAFDTQIGITGCILSKLDGDSRGGAALSLVQATGKKIKFMGVGEKIDTLKEFDPVGIASRILGFGDVLALVKEAEEKFEKKEIEDLNKKLSQGQLNFELFAKVQKLMKKLGGMGNIFGLMGMNQSLGNSRQEREHLLKQGEKKFKEIEYITQSMTKLEREDPNLLSHSHSRVKRISQGSGISLKRVQTVVKEFQKLQSVFGMVNKFGGLKDQINDLSSDPSSLDISKIASLMKKQKKEQKKATNGLFKRNSFFRF